MVEIPPVSLGAQLYRDRCPDCAGDIDWGEFRESALVQFMGTEAEYLQTLRPRCTTCGAELRVQVSADQRSAWVELGDGRPKFRIGQLVRHRETRTTGVVKESEARGRLLVRWHPPGRGDTRMRPSELEHVRASDLEAPAEGGSEQTHPEQVGDEGPPGGGFAGQFARGLEERFEAIEARLAKLEAKADLTKGETVSLQTFKGG